MCVGLPAMTGARTPTASVTSMIIAPTSVIFRRVSAGHQRGAARTVAGARGTSSGLETGRVTAMSDPSLVLHPRIDQQVRKIHRQVHQHVHAGHAEHHALHDRIVAS